MYENLYNEDNKNDYGETMPEEEAVENVFELRSRVIFRNNNAEKGLHVIAYSIITIIIAAIILVNVPVLIFGIISAVTAFVAFICMLYGRFLIGRDIKTCMVSFAFYIVYTVLFIIRSGMSKMGLSNYNWYGYLDSSVIIPREYETELFMIAVAVLVVAIIVLTTFWIPIGKELKKNNVSPFACYLALAVGLITEAFNFYFVLGTPIQMGAVYLVVTPVVCEYCSRRIGREVEV